jgi:hypothetical protein
VLDGIELLKRLYPLFNARDLEGLLASMHHDVVWANGMEGGHVHGRDGVRDYWTRQWAIIDPRVDPMDIQQRPTGEFDVQVHAVVRDLTGTLLSDQLVGHVFRIEDGLVRRFDIQESGRPTLLR